MSESKLDAPSLAVSETQAQKIVRALEKAIDHNFVDSRRAQAAEDMRSCICALPTELRLHMIRTQPKDWKVDGGDHLLKLLGAAIWEHLCLDGFAWSGVN